MGANEIPFSLASGKSMRKGKRKSSGTVFVNGSNLTGTDGRIMLCHIRSRRFLIPCSEFNVRGSEANQIGAYSERERIVRERVGTVASACSVHLLNLNDASRGRPIGPRGNQRLATSRLAHDQWYGLLTIRKAPWFKRSRNRSGSWAGLVSSGGSGFRILSTGRHNSGVTLPHSYGSDCSPWQAGASARREEVS